MGREARARAYRHLHPEQPMIVVPSRRGLVFTFSMTFALALGLGLVVLRSCG